jgi:hypothetical protein
MYAVCIQLSTACGRWCTLTLFQNLADHSRLMKQPVKILQSMRAGRFGDLTVLGSQYIDRNRVSHWCCAVWSEQEPDVRTYWISATDLPENLTGKHREAVLQAIRMWEPASSALPRA